MVSRLGRLSLRIEVIYKQRRSQKVQCELEVKLSPLEPTLAYLGHFSPRSCAHDITNLQYDKYCELQFTLTYNIFSEQNALSLTNHKNTATDYLQKYIFRVDCYFYQNLFLGFSRLK